MRGKSRRGHPARVRRRFAWPPGRRSCRANPSTGAHRCPRRGHPRNRAGDFTEELDDCSAKSRAMSRSNFSSPSTRASAACRSKARAAGGGQQAAWRHEVRARLVRSPSLRRREQGNHGVEEFRGPQRLGDIRIHSRGETAFTVALHGVGRHGHDGRWVPLSRSPPDAAWSLPSRPFPASARP